MVDESRPTTWITTAFSILCLTFLGCATPASQQPQKNRKLVDLRIPKIGTEAHWRIVTNGEETILSGVFVKEKIDGILSYYWKNQERDHISF